MEFNLNKELLSNTLALNVALQTIKERCMHLQKRLYALESENSRLRLNNVNSSDNKSRNSDNSMVSELEDLRGKNAELTLQKSQLTENHDVNRESKTMEAIEPSNKGKCRQWSLKGGWGTSY